MIGLASVDSRIRRLENEVQQRRGVTGSGLHASPALAQPPPLQPTLPPLSGADGKKGDTSTNTLPAHLHALTQRFQQLLSSSPELQQYLSIAPRLMDQVQAEGAVSARTPMLPPSIISQEEEVVLSAAPSIESTASMLQSIDALSKGVLDKPWPLTAAGGGVGGGGGGGGNAAISSSQAHSSGTDIASLTRRVDALLARLPHQAWEAAQAQVEFERFLRAYHAYTDLLSRQFIMFSQTMSKLEREVEEEERKKRRT